MKNFGVKRIMAIPPPTDLSKAKSFHTFYVEAPESGDSSCTQIDALTELIAQQAISVNSKNKTENNELKLTCVSWINELKRRAWFNSCVYTTNVIKEEVEGCLPCINQVETLVNDKKILLKLVKKNNEMFSDRIKQVVSNVFGYVMRLELQDKSFIGSRGDLHSDIASFVALLDALQKETFLNEDYTCKQNFKFVLCGDYGGRGVNDVEVYILLLLWRLENPTSVIPIRGNHETITMQVDGSSDAFFFAINQDLFENCYKSFPLAVCITVPSERLEYVHVSHALFPVIDVSSLLDGKKDYVYLPDASVDSERFAHMGSESDSPKKKLAFEQLKSLPPSSKKAASYYWGDPGQLRHVGTTEYTLSPEQIHHYARIAGNTSSIKFFLWGHQHIFLEVCAETKIQTTKVIGIVLPAATVGGLLKKQIAFQPIQGFIFQVAPRVKHWKKQSIISFPGNGFATHVLVTKTQLDMHTPIT